MFTLVGVRLTLDSQHQQQYHLCSCWCRHLPHHHQHHHHRHHQDHPATATIITSGKIAVKSTGDANINHVTETWGMEWKSSNQILKTGAKWDQLNHPVDLYYTRSKKGSMCIYCTSELTHQWSGIFVPVPASRYLSKDLGCHYHGLGGNFQLQLGPAGGAFCCRMLPLVLPPRLWSQSLKNHSPFPEFLMPC